MYPQTVKWDVMGRVTGTKQADFYSTSNTPLLHSRFLHRLPAPNRRPARASCGVGGSCKIGQSKFEDKAAWTGLVATLKWWHQRSRGTSLRTKQ